MSSPALGQSLALLSAFAFAGATVCVARATATKGDKGVLFSVLVTIVLSTALWIVLEGADVSVLAAPGASIGLLWFAIAGLCAMVFGRTLIFVSISRLGVTRAAATKRINPFFAAALGAVLLGEAIPPLGLLGMAVIAAGFAVLVVETLRDPRPRPDGSVPVASDYLWGVGAALSYAMAYITRKLGLTELPSPALGTLVSAIAGLLVLSVWAAFNARQRANLYGVFRWLDRWSFGAAVLISVGQIAMFAALMHEDVAVVALISSLEVFIASFIAVTIFKTEARPSAVTYTAAVLATVGVIMVAAS